jgi:hypothetical protein
MATILQKVLRPRRAAVSLSKAFASTRYDTSRIESLAATIKRGSGRAVAAPGAVVASESRR